MFKLDNGSELFSSQGMQRMRKVASNAPGSRPWVVEDAGEDAHKAGHCSGDGACSCVVKCARCRCAMRAAAGKCGETVEVADGTSGE